ncbi:MAG: glycosyltransferase [Verrucomicrobia bacterium]|nr:glycosyltransferase [Verrucomicrobiota bacterium]MCG2679638.1 glycosyltransferase [Kiritimatiellia bacterium]MBU4247961.1 glycosyltransferase [Verrucomicrobiota bacterium]MBU4291458.1 glycosyltransferase [Verrucomicrobiota bacterium]MBU4428362.1 glycosyltransferase [Verrucomicrobiota bacterium]
MRDIFILPWLFVRICWDQGIHKALQMTFDKITHRAFRVKVKFPHTPPSNAAAYLHLLKIRPLISIVMPVHNSRWLGEAVASVLRQSYAHWELILVDDATTDAATLKALEAATADGRVKLIRSNANNFHSDSSADERGGGVPSPENIPDGDAVPSRRGSGLRRGVMGISAATNVGINAITGDYVAFMDHDDLLHPDALALLVRTLNDGQEADVFYSDENRIDESGYIIGVTRKCPISLDLLLSCNAVGHLCVVKRDALRRLGPLKSEYDGAQDHDLVLRAWEQGMTFRHLPYLLYGWRMHPASMSDGTRKGRVAAGDFPRAYLSGKALIRAYLDRHGIRAEVTDDGFPWYRVRYALPGRPDEVAIIVPFKDKIARLKVLLASMQKTAYPHYRLFLVNNRSARPETIAYLEEVRKDPRVTILDFDEPFNYSRLHNEVVKNIPNEILLFLNNDMEIIQPDWMEAMLEHIYRENVAAVGCKLIIDGRTIQHAGMAFKPSVLFCALNLTDPDQFYTRVQRDVSGVTAACMMIRKSVFERVGGFDAVHFSIGFSDSDLCLKLIRDGHKIIYTPFAVLVHHESQSRLLQEEAYEMVTLFRRYGGTTPMDDVHYPTQFLDEPSLEEKLYFAQKRRGRK